MMFTFKLIFLICFASVGYAKFTNYYAEPYHIESQDSGDKNKVEASFHLQQMSLSSVVVVGDVHVKERIGPMRSTLGIQLWTGSNFIKSASDNYFSEMPNACADFRSMDILRYFEPKQLSTNDCTFDPGQYKVVIDFNEMMHLRYQKYTIEPFSFRIKFMEVKTKPLFGFSIMLNIHDEVFYNFSQGWDVHGVIGR